MKKKIVLFMCLFCAGCETSAKYNAELNKWIGKSQTSLVRLWGEPNGVFKLGQNDKIITYTKDNQILIPPQYTFYNPDFNSMDTLYAPFSYNEDFSVENVSAGDGYVINNICQTSFHIKDGIIRSWQWRGNDCKAF